MSKELPVNNWVEETCQFNEDFIKKLTKIIV